MDIYTYKHDIDKYWQLLTKYTIICAKIYYEVLILDFISQDKMLFLMWYKTWLCIA